MELDRQQVIASLGGEQAVGKMDSEARAEALEEHVSQKLDAAFLERFGAPREPLSVAELDAQIDTRGFRRGVGSLFASGALTPFGNRLAHESAHVQVLKPMPAAPTLADFFALRFAPATHVLQSADQALTAGLPEDIVFACLLHDVAQALMKSDHGWWGAQLFEPYVSPRVAFAIRYHQALRFYPDPAVGYEYPTLYNYALQLHLRQRLRTAAVHRSRLPILPQSPVVRCAAVDHGERFVLVRSQPCSCL